jgi:hypothetical protein
LLLLSGDDEPEYVVAEKRRKLSDDVSTVADENRFSELSDFDISLNRIELYKRAR